MTKIGFFPVCEEGIWEVLYSPATPHLPHLSTCPTHHSGLKGWCGPPFLSSFPPCGQLSYQVPSALLRCTSHSWSLPTISMMTLLPGPTSLHCWTTSMASPSALCHMPLLKSQQGISLLLGQTPKASAWLCGICALVGARVLSALLLLLARH